MVLAPAAPLPAAATAAGPAEGLAAPDRARAARRRYLTGLGWAFAFFNTARTFAYLPTIWAIVHSGDSSQHSLWTWLGWLGSNATMALWLRERNGGRLDRAAAVNTVNATMCALVTAVILWSRW